VDLERGEVLDLLPDRQAATLAAWLKAHPGVEIIARDRASAYAEGAREGAPDAVQVADRWHLLHNLAAALGEMLAREHATLRAAAEPAHPAMREAVDPATASAPPHAAIAPRGLGIRARRGSGSKGPTPGRDAGHSMNQCANCGRRAAPPARSLNVRGSLPRRRGSICRATRFRNARRGRTRLGAWNRMRRLSAVAGTKAVRAPSRSGGSCGSRASRGSRSRCGVSRDAGATGTPSRQAPPQRCGIPRCQHSPRREPWRGG
jgi:hypothetical protein